MKITEDFKLLTEEDNKKFIKDFMEILEMINIKHPMTCIPILRSILRDLQRLYPEKKDSIEDLIMCLTEQTREKI